MHKQNLSYSTLFSLLKTTATNLHTTKILHALAVTLGQVTPVLGAQLVNNYSTNGHLDSALNVFDELPKRNSFAWNSVFKGLIDAKKFNDVLLFYQDMVSEGVEPDNFTYPLVLKACACSSDINQGRKIYELIKLVKTDVYSQCAAIDMFAKCGSVDESRRVFEEMDVKDLVCWSAMIGGFIHNGNWLDALALFQRMRFEGFGPDSVIVATVVPACGRICDLRLGISFHCYVIKSGMNTDLCVSNALIDMYCKCGDANLGFRVFQFMEYRDVVTWSSLVAGYSQNCEYYGSLQIFVEMVESGIKPSSVTIASVLSSLAEMRLLEIGKEIHCYVVKHEFASDKFIASALIDLYWKFSLNREAQHVLKMASCSDIAMWNSMISGYASVVGVDCAFEILRRIGQSVEQRPNSVTLVTVLPLCNQLTMIIQGKELHGYAIRADIAFSLSVNNSLIDMYCKCGCLLLGKKVFELMTCRDVVTYNTIIAAFGMHGHGHQAISFFKCMREENIQPDKVTFVAIISACSHSGLIKEGLLFYKSMTVEYDILPEMEHYSCIVDLYSRSGYLDEAWEFIQKMPLEPNIDVLGSLLASCRDHKRVDLAEVVGKKLFQKKHEDPGYHILLSNIYASAGWWDDATFVRSKVKDCGLMKKKPGNSRM